MNQKQVIKEKGNGSGKGKAKGKTSMLKIDFQEIAK